MPQRYLSKFTSADGSTTVVTFPTFRYEYDRDQELNRPSMPLSGGDYEYDLMGIGPLVKKNAIERVRFYVVGSGEDIAGSIDDQIEDISVKCHSIGRGKLWQSSGDGERWAWGRLDAMPTLLVTVETPGHQPMFLTFVRMSDWSELDS